MQGLRSRPAAARRGSIVYLNVEELRPNPVQPRTLFDTEGLEELSRSIASYGILNPLTVRFRGGHYELIAGERRLRAAKLAGLREVPCILMDLDLEDASFVALVENLQRRDLDFIEEANGLNRLIRMFGLSQEEAAKRIGKSQSAVANKLRLLRLPQDILDALRRNSLTERHGRALLRLPDADSQRSALGAIVAGRMTVSETDAYIDALLAPPPKSEPAKAEPRRMFIMKDVRIFLNTVSRSLEVMKQGGIEAGMKREETDDSLILTISIPKAHKNV